MKLYFLETTIPVLTFLKYFALAPAPGTSLEYLIHPFRNQPRGGIPTVNLEKLSKRFNLDGKREFLAKWR